MTDLNHPNVRASLLRETTELFRHASEDGFDPHSDQDKEWMTATFSFLVGLIATDSDMAMVQTAWPGAEVVAPQPQPAPVAYPQPNPEPFPQPAAPPMPYPQQPQAVAYPQPQAMPYNAPPQAVPQGQLHAMSSKDEIWAAIVGGLQSGTIGNDWYDNRLSKRSANHPDFRHKTLDAAPTQQGKVYKISAYIKDAPPWALQILQQYPPRS